MHNFFKKYRNYLIGISLGAVAGFLYWRFVGCNSGTCPITSTWHNSAGYGALIGALLASPSKKEEKKLDKEVTK